MNAPIKSLPKIMILIHFNWQRFTTCYKLILDIDDDDNIMKKIVIVRPTESDSPPHLVGFQEPICHLPPFSLLLSKFMVMYTIEMREILKVFSC